MTRRREMVLAITLLVVGGALALLVAQATWVRVRPAGAGSAVSVLVGVRINLDVTGTDVAAVVVPLAVLAVAGALGVLAARGWLRRALGALLALAGAGLVVVAVQTLADPRSAVSGTLARQSVDETTAAEASYTVVAVWPTLVVIGGLAVLAGGLLTAVRSGGWPAMGARYDAPVGSAGAPAGATPARPVDPWTALDRGEDPTATPAAPAPTDLPE